MVTCLTPLLLSGALWFPGFGRPDSIGYVEDPVTGARCHWDDGDLEDRCTTLLTYVQEAWTAQVDVWGYHAPFPDDGEGGSTGLDIYFTRDAAWGAYTASNYEDAQPGDGYMGSWSYIVMDPRNGERVDHTYIAHEFNHVLQYATDFTEYSLAPWEGAATVAEEWTYPGEGTWDSVGIDFQKAPFANIMSDGYALAVDHGMNLYYEYGTALWFMYLQDQGIEPPVFWEALVNAEETWENEPDAWDAWDTTTGDGPQALIDFALDRGRIGTADSPGWAEGFGFGPRMVVDVEELGVEVEPEEDPYELGTVYFDVLLEGPLELEVVTDVTTKWAAGSVTSGEAEDCRWH